MTATAPLWRITAALAITETVSWGTLYYAYPVLAVPMAADFGVTPAALTSAISVALAVSGLAATPVGAWIDRHGPRQVMTAGSVLGGLAVLAVAAAPTVSLVYGAAGLVGVAMAMTLYDPASAVVAHYLHAIRRQALFVITATAALASTIFSPLAATLADQHGWRLAAVALAALLLAVTVPIHAAALAGGPPRPAPRHVAQPVTQPQRHPQFRRVAVAFAVEKAVATAVTVHLVAFLIDQGLALTPAAAAAGLLGVAKIVGRGMTTLANRSHSARTLSVWAFAIQAVALTIPVVTPADSHVAIAVLIGSFGATSGAATVLWPLLLVEEFGNEAFGRLNGLGALAATAPRAMAPAAVGAAAVTLGSYTGAWVALALLAAAAAVCAHHSGRPNHAESEQPEAGGTDVVPAVTSGRAETR